MTSHLGCVLVIMQACLWAAYTIHGWYLCVMDELGRVGVIHLISILFLICQVASHLVQCGAFVFLWLQVWSKIKSFKAWSRSRWILVIRAFVIWSCNFLFCIYSLLFYLLYCNIHKNIVNDNLICVWFNKAQGFLIWALYNLLIFIQCCQMDYPILSFYDLNYIWIV
jgi:hypothetical protein